MRRSISLAVATLCISLAAPAGTSPIAAENPLRISLVLPSRATIANSVFVAAQVSGDVIGVQFSLDGASLGEPVSNPPFRVNFDTTRGSNGRHVLGAIARDTSGNTVRSEAVTVDVANRLEWFSAFTPLRQLFVSSTGTGTGESSSSPMSLSAAVATARPGDLYWLLGGTYGVGHLILTRAGTETEPIAYRAVSGERVTIDGTVTVNAADNWIWGLEISGQHAAGNDGIELRAAGARAINNVIHDVAGNGIGAWNLGARQVIYGNVLYGGVETPLEQRGHLVYTQNDFRAYGYKYFIGNTFVDPPQRACNLAVDSRSGAVTSASDCFAFHAYTEGNLVTGMHLENNIIASGRALIGGFNLPADNEIVRNNSYRRPTQVEFVRNYVGRGELSLNWWWGADESQFTQVAPNRFVENEVYSDSGNQVRLRTSSYSGTSPAFARCEGCGPLSRTDVMDDNVYGGSFGAEIQAANMPLRRSNTLGAWQADSAKAGQAFDLHSRVDAFPTINRVFVYPNEYEPGHGTVALYNWSLSSTGSIDISSIVSVGSSYTIHRATAPYGTAIAGGTYPGGWISVPTDGAEFVPLVVTSRNAAAGVTR